MCVCELLVEEKGRFCFCCCGLNSNIHSSILHATKIICLQIGYSAGSVCLTDHTDYTILAPDRWRPRAHDLELRTLNDHRLTGLDHTGSAGRFGTGVTVGGVGAGGGASGVNRL